MGSRVADVAVANVTVYIAHLVSLVMVGVLARTFVSGVARS